MALIPPARRELLRSAMIGGLGVLAPRSLAAAQGRSTGAGINTPAPEFYELRAYQLVRGTMQARLSAYLQAAFIPAARQAGCGPIGVFTVAIGMANPTLHVLIPHPSLASFVNLPDRLAANPAYAEAARSFLALAATDPPYRALDVKLVRAFAGFPRLEIPAATAQNAPRIFELRTYRSHAEQAGTAKIRMFDQAGEITIFRRTGLTPVFFGQDLTGPALPSLTYLLTFPDLATRERNWNAFRADPEWVKMSTTPGFTDPELVTGADNQILAPTPFSQI